MAELQEPARLIGIDVDESNKTVTITLPADLADRSDTEFIQILDEIERARDGWSGRGYTVHAGG